MFKVNDKDTRTTPNFRPCSSVSIVNFEQVDADWDCLDTYAELCQTSNIWDGAFSKNS